MTLNAWFHLLETEEEEEEEKIYIYIKEKAGGEWAGQAQVLNYFFCVCQRPSVHNRIISLPVATAWLFFFLYFFLFLLSFPCFFPLLHSHWKCSETNQHWAVFNRFLSCRCCCVFVCRTFPSFLMRFSELAFWRAFLLILSLLSMLCVCQREREKENQRGWMRHTTHDLTCRRQINRIDGLTQHAASVTND